MQAERRAEAAESWMSSLLACGTPLGRPLEPRGCGLETAVANLTFHIVAVDLRSHPKTLDSKWFGHLRAGHKHRGRTDDLQSSTVRHLLTAEASAISSDCFAAVPRAGDYSVPGCGWVERLNVETFNGRFNSAALCFCFVYGSNLCFKRGIAPYLKTPC